MGLPAKAAFYPDNAQSEKAVGSFNRTPVGAMMDQRPGMATAATYLLDINRIYNRIVYFLRKRLVSPAKNRYHKGVRKAWQHTSLTKLIEQELELWSVWSSCFLIATIRYDNIKASTCKESGAVCVRILADEAFFIVTNFCRLDLI